MKKRFITFGFCILVVFIVQSQTGDVKTKASITRGKIVYNKYCLTCHQADGGGVPRMNPPLIKTEYVAGDKERLIGIVLKGFNQPIEINGEEFSNVMASHAFLTDLEVADVLTYVRNSFGNKYAAITTVEVKSVRSKK